MRDPNFRPQQVQVVDLDGDPNAVGAFHPTARGTYAINANGTLTNRVAVPTLEDGGQIRIVNGGSDCRIEFGDANVSVLAPVAGMAGSLLVKAGFTEVMSVPRGTTHIAAACPVGSSQIEFTVGRGI